MKSLTANRYVVHIFVIVPFLATLAAIWLLWERAVHWTDLAYLAIFYSLVVLGVGIGYHRMLTHRSFRAHPVVKVLFLLLGSMALEGPALEWAATHIMLMLTVRVIRIVQPMDSSMLILAGFCMNHLPTLK